MNSPEKCRSPGPSKHLKALTPLRGLAAVGVIVHHYPAQVAPFAKSGWVTQGYLAVDFFFVLSGFILTHVYGEKFRQGISTGAVGDYLRARVARIYPVHLLGIALLAFSNFLFPSVRVNFPGDFKDLIQSVFLVQATGVGNHLNMWNFPAWSLSAEWWTYLLAIPLFRLTGAGGPWRKVFAAALCFVGLHLLISSRLPSVKPLDATFRFGVLRCFFEFTLGHCLYALFKNGKWGRALGSAAGAGLSVALVLTLLHYKLSDILMVPAYCLLILCFAHSSGWVLRLLETAPSKTSEKCRIQCTLCRGLA